MNNSWVGVCPSGLALSFAGEHHILIVKNSLFNQGPVKSLSARQLRRVPHQNKYSAYSKFPKGPDKSHWSKDFQKVR